MNGQVDGERWEGVLSPGGPHRTKDRVTVKNAEQPHLSALPVNLKHERKEKVLTADMC